MGSDTRMFSGFHFFDLAANHTTYFLKVISVRVVSILHTAALLFTFCVFYKRHEVALRVKALGNFFIKIVT